MVSPAFDFVRMTQLGGVDPTRATCGAVGQRLHCALFTSVERPPPALGQMGVGRKAEAVILQNDNSHM